jgi:hypothetical protein
VRVGNQLRDPAEVKAALLQQLQEPRVLPGGARHGDPQVGLVLREVEHLGAVREHRRTGFPSVQTPGVDLGNVGDQIRLDVPRPGEDVGQAAQQLVVGQCSERA